MTVEPELPEQVRHSFEFGTRFEGINATDRFSLNSVLGASIEDQVARTLNKMRSEWDRKT